MIRGLIYHPLNHGHFLSILGHISDQLWTIYLCGRKGQNKLIVWGNFVGIGYDMYQYVSSFTEILFTENV